MWRVIVALVPLAASFATAWADTAAGGRPSPAAAPQSSESGASATVQDAQNPLADVISIPFQNNTYFGTGPEKKTANILVVEPVVPFHLNSDWNLIARIITPVEWSPRFTPTEGSKSGLGNVEPAFYLSPAHPGAVLWGAGVKMSLPTATDARLGNNKWGAGPAFGALTFQGAWTFGVIADNVWAGARKYGGTNTLTFNPFVFYNFNDGWYVLSSGVTTADWMARAGQQWTVPLGGGFGRLFHVGALPINARIQYLDNVERPDFAPKWQLQVQVQFFLPG